MLLLLQASDSRIALGYYLDSFGDLFYVIRASMVIFGPGVSQCPRHFGSRVTSSPVTPASTEKAGP